jgi:hypothetical protein
VQSRSARRARLHQAGEYEEVSQEPLESRRTHAEARSTGLSPAKGTWIGVRGRSSILGHCMRDLAISKQPGAARGTGQRHSSSVSVAYPRH